MSNPNALNIPSPVEVTPQFASTAGRTALELLAHPVEDYMQPGEFDDGRPLVSTPTQQRTFDQAANRPDSVPDISQE